MNNKKKFKFKYLNKIFKTKVLIYLNYNNNSRNWIVTFIKEKKKWKNKNN